MAAAKLCDLITAPNCHPSAWAADSGPATFVSGALGYEQHALWICPCPPANPLRLGRTHQRRLLGIMKRDQARRRTRSCFQAHVDRWASAPRCRSPWIFKRAIARLLRLPPLIRCPQGDDRDAIIDEDLQLSLYCCYELHYRGLPGVSDDWEWEPCLLELRRRLEVAFEEQLAVGASRSPGNVFG